MRFGGAARKLARVRRSSASHTRLFGKERADYIRKISHTIGRAARKRAFCIGATPGAQRAARETSAFRVVGYYRSEFCLSMANAPKGGKLFVPGDRHEVGNQACVLQAPGHLPELPFGNSFRFAGRKDCWGSAQVSQMRDKVSV